MAERAAVACARAPRDVTQGNLAPHIWALAWPVTLSQMLFMLPNLYDAVWLGQLGHEAQAAAGLAMSVRFTMISVLMALSLGSGAVVARYVGAKEGEQADLAAMQAVILMALSSGLLGAIGAVFARPFMVWAGADEAVLPLAVRYARILFLGLISMEMVPSVGFMLSAAGAPQVVLAMTLWSSGTLLIGEPFLTRWLGIDGAALALVSANTVGMLWGLGVLVSGRGPVHLDLRKLRLDLPMMGRILRIAAPAVIQRGTPNVANTLLTRFVSAYGSSVLAAWIVARRVFQVATVPGMGLSRVAPAMVGQNLGAGQPERAQRAVDVIARATALTSAVVLGALAAFAPQAMRLFSGDPQTISGGAYILRVLGLGYLAFSVSFVYDAAQGGAGDTTSPMLINVVSLWAVQVPVAFLSSRYTSLRANGVWLGLSVGWIVQLVLMWWRYRQGRWKEKRF